MSRFLAPPFWRRSPIVSNPGASCWRLVLRASSPGLSRLRTSAEGLESWRLSVGDACRLLRILAIPVGDLCCRPQVLASPCCGRLPRVWPQVLPQQSKIPNARGGFLSPRTQIEVTSVGKYQLNEAVGIGFKSRSSLLVRNNYCLLYTSPSPRDRPLSRMPSSA